MILTLEDVLIAARTVYGESRGEPPEGRLAVARVLVNRWRSSSGQWAKDDTLSTACLRNWQFSCWNKSDPNFAKVMAIDLGDPLFRSCLSAVLAAVDLADKDDPTEGARHYHASTVKPSWAKGKRPCAVIGRHVFYNNVR